MPRWLDVVAVHADVEHADRCVVPPNTGEQPGQALGQVNAAALDADQPDALAVGVGLGDLVRGAREAALDRVGVEEQFFVSHGGGCGHKKTNLRCAR